MRIVAHMDQDQDTMSLTFTGVIRIEINKYTPILQTGHLVEIIWIIYPTTKRYVVPEQIDLNGNNYTADKL